MSAFFDTRLLYEVYSIPGAFCIPKGRTLTNVEMELYCRFANITATGSDKDLAAEVVTYQIEGCTGTRRSKRSTGIRPFYVTDFHSILPIREVDLCMIFHRMTFAVTVGDLVRLFAKKQFANI